MLFSDRTSTHYLQHQLRSYFSSIAYVLLQMLRTGLATVGPGAVLHHSAQVTEDWRAIRITVRKVCVSLAGAYPYVALFQQIYEKLCAVPLKY